MSIEDRISRLEKENRRLRAIAFLGLLVMTSVLLMGQARPSQRVSAQVFALTNQDGAIVGEFKANESGLPTLQLYYPNSTEPAIALRLYERVIRIPVERQGQISRMNAILVSRPNGNGAIDLSAEDDRAGVQVLDAHNSVIAQMSSYGDYDGMISLQRVGPRSGAFPDGPVQTIFRVP